MKLINYLGNRLLKSGHIDESLKIFNLNMTEYPNSGNTYDSYADALLAKGDSLNALEHYKICYDMDSTLTYAKNKYLRLESMLNN